MSNSLTADCPACDVKTSAFFQPTVSQGKAHYKPARFFSCQACGLNFQEVAEEEDGTIFASVEYDREVQTKSAQRTGKAEWWRLYDANTLCLMRELAPGSRVLDIGSGDGRFLGAARSAGFDVVGVDISPELAQTASETSGATVHAGWLPDLRLPEGSFDAVNLDLVMMYVPEPLALLQEIQRLLAPGGVCRIREYVNDSVSAKLRGRNWWFYADTTLRAFSRRSLQVLAERAGLQAERAYVGTEASSMLWQEQRRARGGKTGIPAQLAYQLKKARLLGTPVAADYCLYLRKPIREEAVEPARSAIGALGMRQVQYWGLALAGVQSAMDLVC